MTERKYYTGTISENSLPPTYTFTLEDEETHYVLVFNVLPTQEIKDKWFNRKVRLSLEPTDRVYERSNPEMPDLPIMRVCNHTRWVREAS